MPSDKFVAKYIRQLEKQLQQQRADLKTLRADLEFYRGKVERLELAISETSSEPARQAYVAGMKPPMNPADVAKMIPGMRPPWGDLKRRWGAMSAADQEKAIAEGWKVEKEEAANEGSS